jgi:hypothetical protein
MLFIAGENKVYNEIIPSSTTIEQTQKINTIELSIDKDGTALFDIY